MEAAAAGAGNDVGKAGGSAADLGRHPAGLGLNFLDRVDIEVAEGGAAHFGVADIGSVHGEGGFDAALAVDGELLGEVGGSIGIGHGSGRQQQQLAEVTLVQGKPAHGVAGERNAAGGFRFRGHSFERQRSLVCEGEDDVAGCEIDGLRVGDAMAVHGDIKRKHTGRQLA